MYKLKFCLIDLFFYRLFGLGDQYTLLLQSPFFTPDFCTVWPKYYPKLMPSRRFIFKLFQYFLFAILWICLYHHIFYIPILRMKLILAVLIDRVLLSFVFSNSSKCICFCVNENFVQKRSLERVGENGCLRQLTS